MSLPKTPSSNCKSPFRNVQIAPSPSTPRCLSPKSSKTCPCGKTVADFHRQSEFFRHMREKHSETKEYQCSKCSRSFAKLCNVKRHEETCKGVSSASPGSQCLFPAASTSFVSPLATPKSQPRNAENTPKRESMVVLSEVKKARRELNPTGYDTQTKTYHPEPEKLRKRQKETLDCLRIIHGSEANAQEGPTSDVRSEIVGAFLLTAKRGTIKELEMLMKSKDGQIMLKIAQKITKEQTAACKKEEDEREINFIRSLAVLYNQGKAQPCTTEQYRNFQEAAKKIAGPGRRSYGLLPYRVVIKHINALPSLNVDSLKYFKSLVPLFLAEREPHELVEFFVKLQMEKSSYVAATKEKKLSEFREKIQTRQKEEPPIGKLIENVVTDPLHCLILSCQKQWIDSVNTIAKATPASEDGKMYSDMAVNVPIKLFLEAVPEGSYQERRSLYHTTVAYFNKTGSDGRLTFKGKHCRFVLSIFGRLFSSCFDLLTDKPDILLRVLAHIYIFREIQLAFALCSRTILDRSQLPDLRLHCRRYMIARDFFFSIWSTAWIIGEVMPVHAEKTIERFGLGLGIGSTQGAEHKNQSFRRYAKCTDNKNTYFQVLRHDEVHNRYLLDKTDASVIVKKRTFRH